MTSHWLKVRAYVNLYERFTLWLALLSGFILTAMALTTVVSVGGRYLFNTPISGDTEIIQMLTAVVIALAMPYCHMRLGNVIVDVFTTRAPVKVRLSLDIIGSMLLAALFLILAMQSYEGGLSAYKYHNETMMLRLKEWWFYMTIALGFSLTSIAGFIKPIALLADYKGAR